MKLLVCLSIIVSFQVLIMTPIAFDPVAKFLGFRVGGTHWKDYLLYAKFLGGDEERQHGSKYEWTIYWRIVGAKIYYSPMFAKALRFAMLFVNVWYFFIRRWCLPQCLVNVHKSLTGPMQEMTSCFEVGPRRWELSLKNSRLAIELLIVCYLSGAQLVPGGHQ